MTRTYDFQGSGENVRTIASAAAASKRFELRLTSSQLDRWRTIAAAQSVSVADMVRAAMDFAAAHMPPGYVVRAAEERVQEALATFGMGDEGEADVRTLGPEPEAGDGESTR